MVMMMMISIVMTSWKNRIDEEEKDEVEDDDAG